MLGNKLTWGIRGSLISPLGGFPNFLRSSAAFAERDNEGSLSILQHTVHHPRFVNGDLQMEQGSNNLIPDSLDLSVSSWVKGSSVIVQSDRIQGMNQSYLADRLSISQITGGNSNAQRLYRDMILSPGLAYTVTFYLRLAGGRLSANDKIQVLTDVVGTPQVSLAPLLNNRVGQYVPVSLTFTTTGTAIDPEDPPAEPATPPTARIQLYIESASSIDWGGIQLELGSVRTSFIPTRGGTAARAGDRLSYPFSPFEGLSTFGFFVHLTNWRGEGAIYQAGDFVLSIEAGQAKVDCGASSLTADYDLPQDAQIAVRVSEALQQIRIYVNSVLRATGSLTGYANASGSVTIGGIPFLQIRSAYAFNDDIPDGGVGVGDPVLDEVRTLFQTSSGLLSGITGKETLVLPPIHLSKGKGRAAVRFPQYRFASQPIDALTAGSGAAAQVVVVTVETIVNASAAQTDWIRINGSFFEFTSDATPTDTEIALGLTALINGGNEPVAAVQGAGADDHRITITADVAGDGFFIEVSPNLSLSFTTVNAINSSTMDVANAADFELGFAQVLRDYALVTDVIITDIDPVGNELDFYTQPGSNYDLLQVGDVVFQPSWKTEIGPTNYVCDHLEGYPDIRILAKSLDGFVLVNEDQFQDRTVTPVATVVL